jgi:hypothetical protein
LLLQRANAERFTAMIETEQRERNELLADIFNRLGALETSVAVIKATLPGGAGASIRENRPVRHVRHIVSHGLFSFLSRCR